MECINVELPIFLTFVVLIVFTNFASWRMKKNSVAGLEEKLNELPIWKLFIGDVALPEQLLSSRGKVWRIASIVFFVCLLILSGAYLYLANQDWVCSFGLQK